MTELDTLSEPLANRLRDGLERLAAVLRTDQWTASAAAGLTPTQAHVLAFLAGRECAGVRVKEIAVHLGVSQPTATDSIAALERKGLVQRYDDPADARATRVRLTSAGEQNTRALRSAPSAIARAFSDMAQEDRTQMLRLVIRVIRQLQVNGAIPIQRMCVNCRHFRPNIHSDAANPHHCAFVDAAFGDRDLRLDCGDHETADPALQSANWTAFDKGSASLQAPT